MRGCRQAGGAGGDAYACAFSLVTDRISGQIDWVCWSDGYCTGQSSSLSSNVFFIFQELGIEWKYNHPRNGEMKMRPSKWLYICRSADGRKAMKALTAGWHKNKIILFWGSQPAEKEVSCDYNHHLQRRRRRRYTCSHDRDFSKLVCWCWMGNCFFFSVYRSHRQS